MASFDSGYGSAYLAKQVGQKRAREIFFLGLNYSAQEAFEMGMVNAVVPHADIETKALEWGALINAKSPTAMRMLKYGFNLTDDGMVGQQLVKLHDWPMALLRPKRAITPLLKSVIKTIPILIGNIK